MGRKVLILISLSLVFLLMFSAVSFAEAADQKINTSISKAVEYLQDYQNNDGGFFSKEGRPSSRALTSWVVMALTAAGEDVTDSKWAPAGKNPVDFLKNYNKVLEATSDYARLLLALKTADQGNYCYGIELADEIISFQQEEGQFLQASLGEKGMINSHMWSILAIAAAGEEIPNKEKAKKWLLDRQNDDGGFGWLEGINSDTDDTGIAIQALVLLGENPKSEAVQNAVKYLKNCQQVDGGFSCGDAWMGSDTNSASSAWVLQGLIAAGEDPQDEKWDKNGNNPVDYLLSLQNSDGSFNWKDGVLSSAVKMTAYSVMALAEKPFPVNIDYDDIRNKVSFSDLSSNFWAYSSIMNLVNNNVLSGYPDGTFKPEKEVSRSEFTKFLISGLNLENLNVQSVKKFPDMSKNHWAGKYVDIAVSKGYITGRTNGKFDPNGKITGAELATMLVRALPSQNIPRGKYWYSGYVQLAEENGLLYPGFNAGVSATRAQCAYSIVKLRNLLF